MSEDHATAENLARNLKLMADTLERMNASTIAAGDLILAERILTAAKMLSRYLQPEVNARHEREAREPSDQPRTFRVYGCEDSAPRPRRLYIVR